MITEHRKIIERCIKKIQAYNTRLESYCKVAGDNELPEIDCTIIGYSPVLPMEYSETGCGIKVEDNGYTIYVEEEQEMGEYFLSGVDELYDTIKYNDRRLRKAWRVFRANNPDEELEKDDE